MWLLAAVGSALFAGATAVLAKLGVRETDSDLVTALRTCVVLAFSWLMVFVVGSQGTLVQVTPRAAAFLVLSGLATGASWLCYFRALSLADVSRVAPSTSRARRSPSFSPSRSLGRRRGCRSSLGARRFSRSARFS